MRCSRAAVLLLLLACGIGARAQATDGLSAAIAQAVSSALGGSSGGGMMGTMGTVHQSLSSLSGAMSTAYAQAGAQAEAALAAFEKQYCTPATFTPSVKVPATFVGHSMAVTFSMGNCTFNESKWLNDDIKELECIEPSISHTKKPATFTSKFHSAPSFTSKVCKVTKTFGEPVEKVLFVFDGTQAPDINALTAQITEEVKKVLGTVGTGMSDIIGSTRSLVSSAVGGAVPAGAYS
ncbi:hypothetical protein ABPG75_001903 [Micractinium tetrahymenae]